MTNLTRVDFSPHIRSHHPKSIIYWVTEGITIDNVKYSIKEFLLKDSGLYAIVTPDDRKYYEAFLTKSDTSEIEKQISEINKKINDVQNYDDSALKSRIESLENKEDKDTTYRPGTGIQFVENNIIGIDDTVATKDDIENVNQHISDVEQQLKDREVNVGDGLTKTNDLVKVDFAVVPTRELVDELDNRVHALENRPDNDTKYLAGTGLTLNDKTFSVDMTKLVSKETIDDINRRLSSQESKVDNYTTYNSGKGVTVNTNKTLDVNLDWLSNTITTNNLDLIKTTRVGQNVYLDLKGLKSYIDSSRTTFRKQFIPSQNRYLPSSITNNEYTYNLEGIPRTNKELYSSIVISIPNSTVNGVKVLDNVVQNSGTSARNNYAFNIPLTLKNTTITTFSDRLRFNSSDIELEISGTIKVLSQTIIISDLEVFIVIGKLLNSVKYINVSNFLTKTIDINENINGYNYKFKSNGLPGVELLVNNIKEN